MSRASTLLMAILACSCSTINAQYVDMLGYSVDGDRVQVAEKVVPMQVAWKLATTPALPRYFEAFGAPLCFGQLSPDNQRQWREYIMNVRRSERELKGDLEKIREYRAEREKALEQWVDTALSDEERLRVDRARFQLGFATYGVFICESEEARELSPLAESLDGLDVAELQRKRLEFVRQRQRRFAKSQAAVFEELLGSYGLELLEKVFSVASK